MEIKIKLTDHEAGLIHTWIRRSIYEDYYNRIADCNMNEEQARDETYNTINAFLEIRDAIEKEWHK